MKAAKRKARAAARAKAHGGRLNHVATSRVSSGGHAALPVGGGSAETRRVDSRHPAVLGPMALAADATRRSSVVDTPRREAADTMEAVGAASVAGVVAAAVATHGDPAGTDKRDRLAECLRLGIGGILLWAGLSKAANGVAFLAALNAYELPFPRIALAAVAIALPWIEILCGVLLVIRTRVTPALLLSLLLTVGFCIATGQAVVRGLDISCGCFDLDFLSATPWPQAQKILESVAAAFVRNLAMLAGIVFLLGRFAPATANGGPEGGPRP